MINNSVSYLLPLICLIISCTPPIEDSAANRHFEINFEIHQQNDEMAALTFELVPDPEYYLVSPHSEGFHQRLIFSIENNDQLLLDGDLIEAPKTEREYDKLTDKEGSFVREPTTYKQNLIVNTQNDFEVDGLIWLEILPNGQAYEIHFVLSYRSRKLSIKHVRISTSDYPSFWDKKKLDLPKTSTTNSR